jgi:hypothetical protein
VRFIPGSLDIDSEGRNSFQIDANDHDEQAVWHARVRAHARYPAASLRLRYPRFGGQKPTYFEKDGRFCPLFAGQEGLRDYRTKFVNREGFVLHLGNKPNDQNPKAEIRNPKET